MNLCIWRSYHPTIYNIEERIKERGTFLASFHCVVTKYPDESIVRVKLLILVHKSTYSQAYKTGMSRQLNTGDQIASIVKKHSNKCLLGLAHFLHFLASRLSCQESYPPSKCIFSHQLRSSRQSPYVWLQVNVACDPRFWEDDS